MTNYHVCFEFDFLNSCTSHFSKSFLTLCGYVIFFTVVSKLRCGKPFFYQQKVLLKTTYKLLLKITFFFYKIIKIDDNPN